jgi:hypothetical protein
VSGETWLKKVLEECWSLGMTTKDEQHLYSCQGLGEDWFGQ